MRNKYVYIDESGNLADTSKFFIVAVVTSKTTKEVEKIISKVRKNLLKKTSRELPEIKYSRTTDKVKKKVLTELSKKDIQIFVWVIDKEGRRIKDTAENYGCVLGLVLRYGVGKLGWKSVWVHRKYAKGGDKRSLLLTINAFLNSACDSTTIKFCSSGEIEGVGLADFVGGLFFEKYNKGVCSLYEIIEDKVAFCEELSWRDIKKQKRLLPRDPSPLTNS